MGPWDTDGYAFGDNDIAAARVALVAELFDDTSRVFLQRSGAKRTALARDLACGTGHRTRLLARPLAPTTCVGMDRSKAFIGTAAGAGFEDSTFFEHDVARVPFPIGLADLLYARFLLSHVMPSEMLLSNWAAQFRPGGLLLLEEVTPSTSTTSGPQVQSDPCVGCALPNSATPRVTRGASTPQTEGDRRRPAHAPPLARPVPLLAARAHEAKALTGTRQSVVGLAPPASSGARCSTPTLILVTSGGIR